MNVTCVFAHQDDEMRCLGTLLRLHASGHRISFVCVTNGDKGLPFGGPDAEPAAAVRDREMRAVAQRFDAQYVCLGREDGFLTELRTHPCGEAHVGRTLSANPKRHLDALFRYIRLAVFCPGDHLHMFDLELMETGRDLGDDGGVVYDRHAHSLSRSARSAVATLAVAALHGDRVVGVRRD